MRFVGCAPGMVEAIMKMILTAGVLCAALLVAALSSVQAKEASPMSSGSSEIVVLVGE